MFEKKFPWGKVTAALLIGVAVGAASALLFAPMTGRKMQKQLKTVMDDGVENVERIVRKVVNA